MAKLVQAHGTIKGASCSKCQKLMDPSVLKACIKKGEIYRCSDTACNHPVKPNIVFFGENLPKDFFQKLITVKQCDLMIVMGTALAVSPFNALVDMAPVTAD